MFFFNDVDRNMISYFNFVDIYTNYVVVINLRGLTEKLFHLDDDPNLCFFYPTLLLIGAIYIYVMLRINRSTPQHCDQGLEP